MRTPKARNVPIEAARVREWRDRFAGYRYAVDNLGIQGWIEQFAVQHRDVAARILDATDFFSMQRIGDAFRQALEAVPGWAPSAQNRQGRWMFSAMCAGAGESGDSMLHQFRIANRLTANSLFCHPSEIPGKRLGADDTLVLVDDFIGTGKQVCTAWENSFSEVVAGVGRVFLIVAAACQNGRRRIMEETGLQVVAALEFNDSDNFFSDACAHFTPEEKRRILHYCTRADGRNPKGFGECGLVVVMQHRCPNDSIPILHNNARHWTSLFPRG